MCDNADLDRSEGANFFVKPILRSLLTVFFLFASLTVIRAAPPAASEPKAADAQARAYYHFTLGHLYQELAGPFRRSDYLRQAIEEYKRALQFDPASTEIVIQLAEVYRTSGRIREAVLETRQLLEKEPDSLPGRRLLGRIYFQTLGELDPSTPPKQTLDLAIEQYENITRLDPDALEDWITLARLYRMSNELEKAEAALKKALELEPESEAALAALASIYTDRGEHEKATALLQSSSAGTSSNVLGALAYAYEQSGDVDRAVDAYRRALQLDTENYELRRRLADLLLRSERLDDAISEYRVLLEVDPEDAESYLRLSQLYRHKKLFAEARDAIEAAKRLAPDNLEVGFNEALLYEAEGNFDGAIGVLSSMLGRMTNASGQYTPEEKRARAIVLERLGQTYRQNEIFDEAVKVFEMLLPLEEASAHRGYAQIAETYRQARQLEDAAASLHQGLERFPDDRDLKLQLAGVMSDTGNLAAAVELARSLLTGGAEDRQVHLGLTQIYERHKRWDEAEAELATAEKLVEGEPETEYIHFLRGALYERQKKYDQAEKEFLRVLEINPESALALNYLGYMFADQGMKLDEAVDLIERALEIDPHNGAYLDSLGWAYFRLGRLELAEKNLLLALQRLSRDPTIHDHLGDVYYKTGRLDLAEKAWERARQEWQRMAPAEFDAEIFARLEEKLKALKHRLAQQTPSSPKPKE